MMKNSQEGSQREKVSKQWAETNKKSQRNAKRLKFFAWGIIGGLTVALIVAISLSITGGDSSSQRTAASGPIVAPQGVTEDGAISIGEESAPVTVELYFDYICPACGTFEEVNGDDLNELIQEGTVRALLHPISFLDRTSRGTMYSTRASNAFATVADLAPQHAWAFHRALYEDQPSENTEGHNDERLAELAQEVGVPEEVTNEFVKSTHEPWIAAQTEIAFNERNISGTPTIFVNGVELTDWSKMGALRSAVEAAS